LRTTFAALNNDLELYATEKLSTIFGGPIINNCQEKYPHPTVYGQHLSCYATTRRAANRRLKSIRRVPSAFNGYLENKMKIFNWNERSLEFMNTVIQKDQVEGLPSILSPSLNPSRQGREVKCRLLEISGYPGL